MLKLLRLLKIIKKYKKTNHNSKVLNLTKVATMFGFFSECLMKKSRRKQTWRESEKNKLKFLLKKADRGKIKNRFDIQKQKKRINKLKFNLTELSKTREIHKIIIEELIIDLQRRIEKQKSAENAYKSHKIMEDRSTLFGVIGLFEGVNYGLRNTRGFSFIEGICMFGITTAIVTRICNTNNYLIEKMRRNRLDAETQGVEELTKKIQQHQDLVNGINEKYAKNQAKLDAEEKKLQRIITKSNIFRKTKTDCYKMLKCKKNLGKEK